MAGLLTKARWKPVLAVYAVMLSAYFIHPFGRALPLWTILDILFALLLIYPVAKLGGSLFKADVKHLAIALVLISLCVSYVGGGGGCCLRSSKYSVSSRTPSIMRKMPTT
jgi:hypothetical protein